MNIKYSVEFEIFVAFNDNWIV